ncbi:putative 34-kDa protein b [Citrus virus B]|nr:putative 34-kDa protein b [Citrus virus B]
MSLAFNLFKHSVCSFAYGEYSMKCSLSFYGNYANIYLPQYNVSGAYMSNVDLNTLRTFTEFENQHWFVKQYNDPFDILPLRGEYNEATHIYQIDLNLDDDILCGGDLVRVNFLKFLRNMSYTGCIFVFSAFLTTNDEEFTLNIVSQRGITSVTLSLYAVKLTRYNLGSEYNLDCSGARGYIIDLEKGQRSTGVVYEPVKQDLFTLSYIPYLLKYMHNGIQTKEVVMIFNSMDHIFKNDSLNGNDAKGKRRMKIICDTLRDLIYRKNIVYLKRVCLIKLMDDRYQILVHFTRSGDEDRRILTVADVSFC